MPAAAPALGALAGSFAGGYVATSLMAGTMIGTSGFLVGQFIGRAVGSMIGSTLAQSVLGKEPDLPDYSTALADRGLLVNTQSSVANIDVIYGTRKVGGNFVFFETSGADNKFLDMVLVIGEGEIESIDQIYLNDVAITDSKFGSTISAGSSITKTVRAESWSYGYAEKASGLNEIDTISVQKKYSRSACTLNSSYGVKADGKTIWVSNGCRADFKVTDVQTAPSGTLFLGSENAEAYIHTGADNQTADTYLQDRVSAWTSAHRLQGTAYVYLRLTYDQEMFPGGIPTITADVKGVKVYDPRTSTTAWSDNPALCIRDYLTNTRYGRGIDSSLIDDTSFSAAANYCDELVTIGGESIKRYTLNGVVDTSRTSLDNIKEMLTACRGFLVFTGGKYRLIIDKPETATFTFDEDNITGSWSIGLGNKQNTFNRIRVNFFNPDRSWQPDVTAVESTALRANDNGLLLEREIELPFTTSEARAKAIATMNLNQSRQQVTCEFTATIEGLRCEVGDVVNITHETPGWSAKKFRIVEMALQSTDEVRIKAIEYDATVYDFGTIPASDPTPNTNLPDPYFVTAPDGMGINETLFFISPNIHNRVTVEWQHNAQEFVARYELEYQDVLDSHWTPIGNFVNQITTIDDVDPGFYNFRVRAVNAFGGVSAWYTIYNQEVKGTSVLPAVTTPAVSNTVQTLYVTTNGSGVKAKVTMTWS
jgi:hypothetical protein